MKLFLLISRFFGVAFALLGIWSMLSQEACFGEISIRDRVQIQLDHYIPFWGFALLLLLPWSRIRQGLSWWVLYLGLSAFSLLWIGKIWRLDDPILDGFRLFVVAAIIGVQLATIFLLRKPQRQGIADGQQHA